MILDIDHIALTVLDVNSKIEFFKNFNYDVRFNEKEIKNLKIKQEFMEKFSPNHDLCLLTSKSNLNIELLRYDEISKDDGYILPIFEYPETFSEAEFNLQFNEMLTILKQSKDNFTFNKFVVQSDNIEESSLFWNEFGFKNIDHDNNHLQFESVFSSKKYDIFIELSEFKRKYFLDNRGWPCVAFITNSIVNEKERLEKKYKTTEIGTLFINEKKIEIFFVKGPSNEIVEIISISA